MAILNQKRILNLIPKTSAPVTIHVSQGDVGTEIEFTLVKGDELFVNTGSLSASVHGVREDGANFGVFTCTLSGSSVKFPLHAEMTAVKGSAIAEIVLVDSQGNKVGSSNFGIMVEESVFPLGVTYDNDVSVYESILAYVQTIPAQVTQDYNTKINAETAARQAADSSLNEALANEISARTSAVSAETSAREAADNALGDRIDQIIAPSGEAPSVAEVTDARVGEDGVTYNTLGSAIRTQIGKINTSIKGRVLQNLTWESGRYSPTTGAKESTSGNFRVTDLVAYSDDTSVILFNYRPIPVRYRIVYYDANRAYIGVSVFIYRSIRLKDIVKPNTAYVGIYILKADNSYDNITVDYGDVLYLTDSKVEYLLKDPEIEGNMTDLNERVIGGILGGDPVDVTFIRGTIKTDGTYGDATGGRITSGFIDFNPDYFLVFDPHHCYQGFYVLADSNNTVIQFGNWSTLKNHFFDGGNIILPFSNFTCLNPAKIAFNFQRDYNQTVSDDDIHQFNLQHPIRSLNGGGLVSMLESTRNYWQFGDVVNFEKYAIFSFTKPIPAGTYTITAETETTNITSDYISVIFLYDNSLTTGDRQRVVSLVKNGKNSKSFTLAYPAKGCYLLASVDSTAATGHTASWRNIQIEPGRVQSNYVPPYTLIDHIARDRDNEGYFQFEDRVFSSDTAFSFSIKPQKQRYQNMKIFCDAKFTRNIGVTDYPRIKFEVITDRGFYRGSTWYKIGEENEYQQREWRAPAYIWDNREVYISIVVPSGCELTIRTMGNVYDDGIVRRTGGLRFLGRRGDCNITPDESKPSMQVAYRHGFDSYIVIPKISSDGQWFAYHDDTWDIATTPLRNTDGSRITDDTYDGMRFDEIPFSYLQQFDWGIAYGDPAMAGTKGLKLEDYFEFCAKVGMAPRFSMHPSVGVQTTENMQNLKALVQKYGLLNKLEILLNNLSVVFPVFGNDIGGYSFGNTFGSTWDGSGGTARIDVALTTALEQVEQYGITTKVNCGMWADGLFSDRTKAAELVEDILDEGFTAGVFSCEHAGIDGTSHSELWSEDIRWLASIGVTEFTDNYNTSVGLNW